LRHYLYYLALAIVAAALTAMIFTAIIVHIMIVQKEPEAVLAPGSIQLAREALSRKSVCIKDIHDDSGEDHSSQSSSNIARAMIVKIMAASRLIR